MTAPSALAEEILSQLDDARDGYAPKLGFDTAVPLSPASASKTLRLPLRA